MLILFPVQCHRVLLQKSVRGTVARLALERASAMGNTILPVDQFAVVCDSQTAEDFLKTAIDHCPEAVPIIVEAIESGKR